MSSIAPPTEQSYRPDIPADEAFDILAFYNPVVCSRCFSRIRTPDTDSPTPGRDGGPRHALDERFRRAGDGVRGYATEAWDEYGYRPFHTPRTFCGECGSQSGLADANPLPQRQAVSFADNLLHRLHEHKVPVDAYALKYVVGQLKEYDRITSYDTEIFRRATRIAIERARQ